MKNIRRRVRRSICGYFGNAKYSKPGLNGLDEKLAPYLNFDGGFFIEAGANDGYNQSNTYYLEKLRGWRGILVEGIPKLANECIQNRVNSDVVNCALVSSSDDRDTVEMRTANLMSQVVGAFGNSELENAHIEAGIKVQNLEESQTISVRALTLEIKY